LGYTGKQAIHPNQLETIYRYFMPPQEAIDFAKEIMTSWNSHHGQGKGVFEVRGTVIDLPMVLWAQKVLGKANVAV
jgi:citrate lyase subunit beta-like protein